MKTVEMPNGYKCEVEENGVITVRNPKGYFKLKGFPHKFGKVLFEYGDVTSNRWDVNGISLVDGRENDEESVQAEKINCFLSVNHKIEVRKRALDVLKSLQNN